MAISKIACFLIYACIFAIAHLNKVGLEQIFFSLNKLLILLLYTKSFKKYTQNRFLKLVYSTNFTIQKNRSFS